MSPILSLHPAVLFWMWSCTEKKNTPNGIQPEHRIRGPAFLTVTNSPWLISLSCSPYIWPQPEPSLWRSPGCVLPLWVFTQVFSMGISGAMASAGRVYPQGQCSDGNSAAATTAALLQETPLCPPAPSKAWEAAPAQTLPQAGTCSCPQRTLPGAFSSAQLDTSPCVSKLYKTRIKFTLFCFCSNPFLYPS